MCNLPVGCCHLGSRVLIGVPQPTTSLGGRLTRGPLYVTLTYIGPQILETLLPGGTPERPRDHLSGAEGKVVSKVQAFQAEEEPSLHRRGGALPRTSQPRGPGAQGHQTCFSPPHAPTPSSAATLTVTETPCKRAELSLALN